MSWSYRKNLIGKVRIYYSSGCVGPVQIPLDELADELNDYEARIAELEADNNRLKCSNDTQTDAVVYREDSGQAVIDTINHFSDWDGERQ